ncbi:hypothetical protein MW887_001154 [Aspergillus wentii]|nr:hypothetical protein MW887_001154 [Aspergillus wentii]
MQYFELSLPSGGIVSGRHTLPTLSQDRAHRTPLIVALHGGSYTSQYFDVNSTLSAGPVSSMTGVPFIAIDRPCYKNTSTVLPLPEGVSFFEAWGRCLHCEILPSLWQRFGVPYNCAAVVLLCHSLGSPGGCVAASLHASENHHTYPLSGIILSGFGSDNAFRIRKENQTLCLEDEPKSVSIPLAIKDSTMIPLGTVHPSVYNYSKLLDHPMPIDECRMATKWFPFWRHQWASNIAVPVMIALGERDCVFMPSPDHLRDFAAAFSSSTRVDTSIIPGAPHSLELSFWSRGWYMRCFGFALECVASFERAEAN